MARPVKAGGREQEEAGQEPPAQSGSPPAATADAALRTRPQAAVLPLALVTALIVWWAWKYGAYFDVVFLPGAIGLLGLLIALLAFAPWPVKLEGGARVSLLALFGLAAWTLASALWSPTPDIAISDAQRVLSYGVAFALGVWLCALLGRGMLRALVPVAGAGAVIAVATLIAIWVGDNISSFLEEDTTLRYPLGYRNAAAAFFGIAIFPMVVLAADRTLDWRARGLLVGCATLSAELVVLTQSRGAVFAFAIAVVALVVVHPFRLRVVGYLLLAAVPAAIALPWLLDVFQEGDGNTAASLGPLHDACPPMAVTSLLACGLGMIAAVLDPSLGPRAARAVGRALAALLAVGVLAGVGALAMADGGPTGFVDRQVDELTQGTPDLSGEQTRFGFDLRSERGDLWRVAIDDFEDHPLRGEGAGAFRFSYLADRDTVLQPEDPHSVEMLLGSELGLPGLLLFGAFVVGAIVAALRARRLGPSPAALAAGALAAGGYWLVHASVEWFWHYPAITLPVAFVLGAAAAPALLRPPGTPRAGWRIPLAIAAGLAALSMIPFFLSDRYTDQALDQARADLPGAYSDVDRAADLDPFATRPLLAEAVIARRAGDSARALAALDEAQERVPDEWTVYYLRALILEQTDPAAARLALERARELNPDGGELDGLERRLSPQNPG